MPDLEDDLDLRRVILTLAALEDPAELSTESRVGDLTVCRLRADR